MYAIQDTIDCMWLHFTVEQVTTSYNTSKNALLDIYMYIYICMSRLFSLPTYIQKEKGLAM